AELAHPAIASADSHRFMLGQPAAHERYSWSSVSADRDERARRCAEVAVGDRVALVMLLVVLVFVLAAHRAGEPFQADGLDLPGGPRFEVGVPAQSPVIGMKLLAGAPKSPSAIAGTVPFLPLFLMRSRPLSQAEPFGGANVGLPPPPVTFVRSKLVIVF